MAVRQGLVFLILAGLSACEAPLDLARVESERNKAVHRYDEFQQGVRTATGVLIVGMGGVVVESFDDGQTLQRTELDVESGYAPSFIDVAQCPDGNPVLLDFGNRIWMRDDDAVWIAADIATNDDVLAIECDHTNRIWVVGGFSLILHTDDGGESWADLSLGDDSQFTNITFVDAENGFIAGEFGMVLKTNDAGATWTMVEPVPNQLYVHDALFVDAQKGWVTGLNGNIYRTDDAGNSWHKEETNTKATLYRLATVGSTRFVAGGLGTLLVNQGDGWSAVDRITAGPGFIRALVPIGDDALILGGAGSIERVSISDFNLAPQASNTGPE